MQVQDLQRATFLNQGRIFVSQDIWKCRIWPKAYFWALTAACFDSFQSLSPTYHSPTIHPLTFSKELLWDACNRNPENKCNSTLIFLTEGRGEIEACTFSFSILFFSLFKLPQKSSQFIKGSIYSISHIPLRNCFNVQKMFLFNKLLKTSVNRTVTEKVFCSSTRQ